MFTVFHFDIVVQDGFETAESAWEFVYTHAVDDDDSAYRVERDTAA